MTLGQHLRRLRGDRLITDVASAMGVHRNTISRQERGERVPDLPFLVRLLDHYNATDDDRVAVLSSVSSPTQGAA